MTSCSRLARQPGLHLLPVLQLLICAVCGAEYGTLGHVGQLCLIIWLPSSAADPETSAT